MASNVGVPMGEAILARYALSGERVSADSNEERVGVCVMSVEYGGDTFGRKSCRSFCADMESCSFWNSYKQ